MGRGEMPIEPGASWFSPKWIEVQPAGGARALHRGRALSARWSGWRLRTGVGAGHGAAVGGRELDGRGGKAPTDPNQTVNAGSQPVA